VNSQKYHYFKEHRSLCGKWAFSGQLDFAESASTKDCADCLRKRTKELRGSNDKRVTE